MGNGKIYHFGVEPVFWYRYQKWVPVPMVRSKVVPVPNQRKGLVPVLIKVVSVPMLPAALIFVFAH